MINDILYTLISGRRAMDAETAAALDEICREYPYCQPARLLLARNMVLLGKDADESIRKHAFAYAGNRKLFSDYLNTPLPSRRKTHEDIINRFLQKEPKISPIKDKLSDENIAQHCLQEDNSLVSETLADILAQQGKKERALQMYKKLSLMFPEKMTYFAKKIETISKSTN
jgi:hypothetical protein